MTSLTPARKRALQKIHDSGDLSVNQAATMVGYDFTKKMWDSMWKDGQIEIDKSPGSVKFHLTDKGRRDLNDG